MGNGTWKIARSRGHSNLPITIVAALGIVVVLLGKAQSTLFDRARAQISDWMAPSLEVARAPLSGFERWMGSFGEIFTVYRENLKLKEENAQLRQWENAAVVLDERVKRYQLLMHAVPDPELSSVLAQVIGRSSRPFQQTMILDAGRANNVKPGQAVVDARGMIGRIYISGERTSWVILLTDLNSRIPVMIEPGNIQAIMAGDNSSSPAIEVLSWNAHLKGGEQIVSSGDGSLLPPGLAIGTVSGSNNAWRVSLLADPGSSQDVSILDYRRPIEDLPTPTPADLPATAAGLAPATAAGLAPATAAPLAPPGAVTQAEPTPVASPGPAPMLKPSMLMTPRTAAAHASRSASEAVSDTPDSGAPDSSTNPDAEAAGQQPDSGATPEQDNQ
jgi:rod shape-determining protein MreC